MDRRYVQVGRGLAAALVFVTASFHLWWGFPRSLQYAQALGALANQGLPPDPRPFLFVAFGFALLAGPYLVSWDVVSLRRAYQIGAAMMVLSFVSWVFWHQTGHGAALTGLQAPDTGHGHSHGGSVLRTIADHYVVQPLEGVIKTVELTAAALFALLLRYDPDAAAGSSETPSQNPPAEADPDGRTVDADRDV